MSKVSIDAREWSTSTGRYVRNLVMQVEKLDSKYDFQILLKSEDLSAWEPSKPTFKKIVCPWREFTLSEQLGFKRQLENLKPDLVHFGMTQQPIWYRGKVVTTIHDLTTLRYTNPSKNSYIFRFKQRVYRYVIQRVAKKSVAIITGSNFVKEDLVKFTGISPNKVSVIHEAADKISAIPEPIDSLKNKRFIMYVGRPSPHKNLGRLIESFGLLKAQNPELLLVLSGKKDANYLRIEKQVKDLGLTNVVFTDFVSEGQLRWLYENTQAYIFPSLSEGFGLPGLEAMAHGAPVVSSNATCLPEIYGEAAHYFNPLDTQAIASAISEVLSDKNLRQSLIQKGQMQVTKYSWTRTAEQTLAVYNKALAD